MEAYKRLRTLREREKFAAWLFAAILRSKCRRYLQRRRHDVSLEEFRDTLAAPLPSDDSALLDALQRLPLQDREVLAARYLQGLAFDEVAGEHWASASTPRVCAVPARGNVCASSCRKRTRNAPAYSCNAP